jgi:hypothetical protein
MDGQNYVFIRSLGQTARVGYVCTRCTPENARAARQNCSRTRFFLSLICEKTGIDPTPCLIQYSITRACRTAPSVHHAAAHTHRWKPPDPMLSGGQGRRPPPLSPSPSPFRQGSRSALSPRGDMLLVQSEGVLCCEIAPPPPPPSSPIGEQSALEPALLPIQTHAGTYKIDRLFFFTPPDSMSP